MDSARILVLFDFDGTITKKDTLFAFARFAVGDTRFLFGIILLGVPLALHKLSIISAQKTKEIFLSYFFGGWRADRFVSTCRKFAQQILPGLVRTQAMEAIQEYRRKGVRMVIVSASSGYWITPWADSLGIEVIATRLEINENVLSGKIEGKNCNDSEKVNRIRQQVQLEDYNRIIAYGDSKGDLPMLALGTQEYFKPFRDRK